MTMNLAMLTDLYEFTMSNGYLEINSELQGNFDIFFRKAPNSSSFVVNAGLSTALTELKNFHFSKEDLAYLESLSIFNEKFIAYLAAFEYNCKLTVIPEGCPVFPLEPIVSIQGPIVQLQLFETMLLNILGHQSLIATTARRMVMAADGKPIIDFGARRAQGPDGAIFGTRAAIIGGVKSTTNVLAAKAFDLPIVGTMAHSWVQSFPNEKTAFKVWAQLYPNALSFLVDTYDVLESGIPNAIDVFKSLDKSVADSWSIRIDSGDLATLVTKSRILLDEAGLQKVKITVSNSLNISDIQSLTKSNIPIDNFGVGENLIVSTSSPVLGMVYKLSAILENKQVVPKIKKSNSSEKTTLPGIKKVYRLYDQHNTKAIGDIITLQDENIEEVMEVIEINSNGQKKLLQNFFVKSLQREVGVEDFEQFINTKVLDLQLQSEKEIKELSFCVEYYPVYVTEKLFKLRSRLLEEHN